jgi:hypothetical protein
MYLIVRPLVVLPNGDKMFFITEQEFYFLRQENRVHENIYFVYNKFWEQNNELEGLEKIEQTMLESTQKRVMLLVDYNKAVKLNERKILPICMAINAVMTNYYYDSQKNKLSSTQVFIKESFLQEGKLFHIDTGQEKLGGYILKKRVEKLFSKRYPSGICKISENNQVSNELYTMQQ